MVSTLQGVLVRIMQIGIGSVLHNPVGMVSTLQGVLVLPVEHARLLQQAYKRMCCDTITTAQATVGSLNTASTIPQQVSARIAVRTELTPRSLFLPQENSNVALTTQT